MRFIESTTKKICETCSKLYEPQSHGRPAGEKSENWIKSRFCGKSCSTKKTTIGRKPCLGKHWKVKDTTNWTLANPKVVKRAKESYKENATYRSLHKWAERWVGKPKICHDCGKTEGRLHLANKDHSYKRNIEDWISLCPKCHGQYDKMMSLRKRRSI